MGRKHASPALDADGRYVDRKLEQALSEDLTKSFWTTPPGETEADPPHQCRMTRDEWLSFTPGMRRAITREFTRHRGLVDQQCPICRDLDPALNEHEQAMVRVEAKARL